MHAFVFGIISLGCFIGTIVVAFGDLGDDATLGFRAKAVVSAFVLGVYFAYSTRKELRREKADSEHVASHGKRGQSDDSDQI